MVWSPEPNAKGHFDTAALSFRNESKIALTMRQCDSKSNFGRGSALDPASYELCIQPGEWLPFGWIDPEVAGVIMVVAGPSFAASVEPPEKIEVKIGEHIRIRTARFDTLDLLNLGDLVGFDLAGIDISVTASAGGKVVVAKSALSSIDEGGFLEKSKRKVESTTAMAEAEDPGAPHRRRAQSVLSTEEEYPNDIAVNFALSANLSIVAERPCRRELLSVSLMGLEASYYRQLQTEESGTTEYLDTRLKILDIQVREMCKFMLV